MVVHGLAHILQYIKHNVEESIKYGTWFKCTGTKAELVIAQHIGLIEEFDAIGVLYIALLK